MTGIKCPYCRSSLALDRIGLHFQKFCSAITTVTARETAMKKYNQFYTQLQSHGRGEITTPAACTPALRTMPSSFFAVFSNSRICGSLS